VTMLRERELREVLKWKESHRNLIIHTCEFILPYFSGSGWILLIVLVFRIVIENCILACVSLTSRFM
jgi:hypothetical protein